MNEALSIALCGLNARYAHTSLALRSLIAYVKKDWPEAPLVLIEGTVNDQPLVLLQKLYSQKAGIYAFSCYIWNIGLVRRLCRDLKKLLPSSLIVWGGPEAGHAAARWLKDEPSVDLIARGEGEAVFLKLLQTLREHGSSELSVVPGISWRGREKGELHENPPALLLNGDEWPFPYTDADLAAAAGRILYLETSRGCPYRCSYCLSALDRGVRYRPAGQTLAEIDRLLEFDLRQVKLVDRTFNCDPDRAYMIWRHLIERAGPSCKTNFHFEVAGDLLDDRTVDLLNTAPAGLIQLEIGVQTIHPDVLRTINRKTDLKRLSRQVSRLRAGDRVHLHLDLIAGLPGESLARFGDSLDFCWSLRPHHLQLGFLKVLPGTPLAKTAKRLGFSWQEEAPYEILKSDQLEFDDLILLKRIAHILDMFTNCDLLRRTIQELARRAGGAFAFFAAFAARAGGEGWLDRPLSPADRCRMLLEFIHSVGLNRFGFETDGILIDMIRLDYQLSGQKDQPAILNFPDSGSIADPALGERARKYFKSRHPGNGRIRVDRIGFDLQLWLAAEKLAPGDWLIGLDLTASPTVMLDICRVDDLY